MSYLASVGESIKQAIGFGSPNPSSAPAANSSPASAENQNNNMRFQAPVAPAAQNNQAAPQAQTPPANAQPADPLAMFSKMYENTATPEAPPAFKLDSAQLQTVANSQDFTKNIDPALLQRATSGDSGALLEVIQATSRNAYSAALEHNSKLTEGFVTAREGFADKGFTGKVKNELTVAALTGTQNFSNPVVKRQLVEVAKQLQKQHPDAAPEEIAQLSRDYITQLADAINPPSQASQQAQRKNQGTDWDKWFE